MLAYGKRDGKPDVSTIAWARTIAFAARDLQALDEIAGAHEQHPLHVSAQEITLGATAFLAI